MDSLDKAILMFLNKASKRIKANFLLNLSIVGLKILLCLIFSLLLISLFISIPYVLEICIGILVIGLVIILIFGFIKSPKKNQIALMVDSKGLDERLITSLGLIECNDNMSIAQKQDTVSHIKNFDIKKNIKMNIDKKQVLLVLALVIMCILVMFVPTTARKEAQKIREFDKYQKSVIEKVEKEKKEIEKSEDLSEEEKEEVKKKLLDEFNKEKEDTAKKDVNKLVNELMKKEESKDLAEAMMNGDTEGINKELEEIQKKLNNMSSAELSELSEALKNAALEMSDEELAEALKNASNSVLDKKLDSESLSDAISKSISNSTGQSSSSQSSESGENQGQGQGSSNGQGSGSGSGEGQGGSSGNGSGAGSGTGWNTGSTEGKENDLENSKGEQIYIPGRNEGEDGNLTGNKNENGNSQGIENQTGMNIGGEKIDYDKVIGDYSNSALEGANNSNLPQSLKDIIKNYFEQLN